MSSENDTSGAHDGEVSAIVTDSLTPMTMPATMGPERAPQPAHHHRGEDDADPAIDLRRSKRVAQRDAHAGHTGERGADAGKQQGERLSVHAEGDRDGAILGRRAQRLADVGIAQARPNRERQRPPRRTSVRSSGAGTYRNPSELGVAVYRLESPEIRRPDRLDQRLDDDRQPERDEERVEGADVEAGKDPLHRDAEHEESRARSARASAADRRLRPPRADSKGRRRGMPARNAPG